jgi:quinol monooxygenase YgiN
MSENIVIVGCSEIREGKLEELKAAMNGLVELVKAKEPQLIAYNIYLNENDTQLTVLQVHPDSASAEFHMEVTGSAFPKELINLSRIDIYGKPSQSLLEKIRISETTGSVSVFMHELHAGVFRF